MALSLICNKIIRMILKLTIFMTKVINKLIKLIS